MKAIICVLLGLSAFSHAGVKCIKGSKPTRFGIYFHGIDKETLSHTERINRDVLSRLAAKNNLAIYLPRGSPTCGSGNLCWQHHSPELAMSVVSKAISESSTCLAKHKPSFFIGFSNGAYLVERAYRSCFFGPKQWAIIAGMEIRRSLPDEAVKKCGKATIYVGEKDRAYKSSSSYFKRMRQKRFPVNLKTHKGGHKLEFHSMESLFEEYSLR